MSYLILRNKIGIFFFYIYAAINGYTFRTAKKGELDEVFRFRWKTYSQEGYIKPENHLEKKFTDEYEDASTSFVALHRNEIIGTVRLTRNSAVGFPATNHYYVDLPHEISSPNSIAEIGRLMIATEHRGRRRIVAFGLAAQFYEYSIRNAVAWWIVFMPEKLKSAFEKFGVHFKILPEKPLLESHINSRNLMPGYFVNNESKPMIANVPSIKVNFH